jgi:hypothetical protein
MGTDDLERKAAEEKKALVLLAEERDLFAEREIRATPREVSISVVVVYWFSWRFSGFISFQTPTTPSRFCPIYPTWLIFFNALGLTSNRYPGL